MGEWKSPWSLWAHVHCLERLQDMTTEARDGVANDVFRCRSQAAADLRLENSSRRGRGERKQSLGRMLERRTLEPILSEDCSYGRQWRLTDNGSTSSNTPTNIEVGGKRARRMFRLGLWREWSGWTARGMLSAALTWPCTLMPAKSKRAVVRAWDCWGVLPHPPGGKG